jgi:hypothetical protein
MRYTSIIDQEGLPASSSTARASPSQTSDEKRTKHRDDLMNAKLIPSILPTYLPLMSGTINRDSVPREFEYSLVTAYLPKGIHAVRVYQDNITALKFSDFNLGDRKVYNMFSPHKYLMRTKGKNSNIVPSVMDHEPRAVHTAQSHEYSSLR